MGDRLEEVQSAIQQMAERLRSLEQRVRSLEAASPAAPATPGDEPVAAILPGLALPQGTVAMVGGTVVFVSLWFGLLGRHLPISIVALELLLSSALLAAIRYSPRFTASFLGERIDDGRQKAIIVGAGSVGRNWR